MRRRTSRKVRDRTLRKSRVRISKSRRIRKKGTRTRRTRTKVHRGKRTRNVKKNTRNKRIRTRRTRNKRIMRGGYLREAWVKVYDDSSMGNSSAKKVIVDGSGALHRNYGIMFGEANERGFLSETMKSLTGKESPNSEQIFNVLHTRDKKAEIRYLADSGDKGIDHPNCRPEKWNSLKVVDQPNSDFRDLDIKKGHIPVFVVKPK